MASGRLSRALNLQLEILNVLKCVCSEHKGSCDCKCHTLIFVYNFKLVIKYFLHLDVNSNSLSKHEICGCNRYDGQEMKPCNESYHSILNPLSLQFTVFLFTPVISQYKLL